MSNYGYCEACGNDRAEGPGGLCLDCMAYNATRERLKALRAAAQAVVDRWDTPNWKDVPATQVYIEALRRELQK